MTCLRWVHVLPLAALITIFTTGCSPTSNGNAPDSSTSMSEERTPSQTVSLPTAPSLSDVFVTVTVQGPGLTELALPVNPDGKRLHFRDTQSTGDWKETYGGDRIQSTQPGSTVSFHILGEKPSIAFLQDPNGAEVSIKYDHTTRSISLHGDNYDWRPEPLQPTGGSTHVR
jgi:hypothetical protein